MSMTRRTALKLLLGAGAAGIGGTAPGSVSETTLIRRAIPSSGERIPIIGLGTARTFDVGTGQEARAPLREVLELFARHGGTVVDTSPMYGRAERVVGDLAAGLELTDALFLATKVWTRGRDAGIAQMQASMGHLRDERIELIQVHNLVDTRTHLDTLSGWKREGRIGYLGVTHWNAGAYPALERVLRDESLDFVQLNYSMGEREAEARLLPMALDRGIAVIANRPFQRGALFRTVRGVSLPTWTGDFQGDSWARFFLKFVISHPAVICAIPATSKPGHLVDNMGAARGGLPDAKLRARMLAHLQSI